METGVKVSFTSASGGLNRPCEIFLAMLGNAYGQNNLLSFLTLRIREKILNIKAGAGRRNGDYYYYG